MARVTRWHFDGLTDDLTTSWTDDVQVVLVPLGVEPTDHHILDAEERARGERFAVDAHRRGFLAAHIAVRQVIGTCLATPPEDLRFANGPYGKPRLVGAGADLRFNLAHSGEWALLAIAAGRDVGIDIEQHRPLDPIALAGKAFSAHERTALDRVAPDERLDAFYRGWTRKESFVKARGEGLSFPLASFDVRLDATDEQSLLACRQDPTEIERWLVRSLDAPRGYSAALTVAVD